MAEEEKEIRMKKIFLVTVTALSMVVVFFMSGVCAADETIQTKLQAMLDARFAAYKATNNLPSNLGILVHVQSPAGAWTARVGLPAGAENAHYRIASVSKTFTAAAIMLLDQQGKLNIQDFVTDTIPGKAIPYLPDSPAYAIPNKSKIRIWHLMSHRAGIFDVFNWPILNPPYNGQTYNAYVADATNDPFHQFTLDELAKVISDNKLFSKAPDVEYKYSDTGYTLLARIIEQVSGKSYDAFIKEQFLGPVGLARTSAPSRGTDIGIPSPYLTGFYRYDGDFLEIIEDNMSSQIGPGNIISTATDMATWMRKLLSGGGPLKKEHVARMTAVPAGNTTYALGIGSTKDVGLGHSGAHPGYMNLVTYHPVDDVAVVVVTPFIDYNKGSMDKAIAQLHLLAEVAREARRVVGYTTPWPVQ